MGERDEIRVWFPTHVRKVAQKENSKSQKEKGVKKDRFDYNKQGIWINVCLKR